MKMDIKFKYDLLMPLAELQDSLFQRNVHPPEQIERLAKIMRVDGVRHPIHVSSQSNRICFGHGRKAAALLNGWDTFPVQYQNFDSATQEYAAVQADNAIAAWSELDLGSINADLPELGPDFDLEMMGLKDFVLDMSEKCLPEESLDRPPQTNEVQCPKCGHTWEPSK